MLHKKFIWGWLLTLGLLTSFLFLLIIDLETNLKIASIISFLNLIIILFIFQFKSNQHHVFYIYYGYLALTLVMPILYMSIMYPADQINYYLSTKIITSEDLVNSNFIILVFTITLAIFTFAWSKKKVDNHNFKFDKYYLSNSNKYFTIFLLLLISYTMKLYLISLGAWFMYEQIDLKQFPLLNTVNLLSNLDLLVLFYIVYLKTHNRLTKYYLNIFIFAIVTSGFFAILATSKEKVLILFIPVIIMFFFLKKKLLPLVLISLLLMNLGSFFDYMMFMRINQSQEVIQSTLEFFNEKKHEKSIFDDNMFYRLDYQTVVARVVKINDLFPSDYKFDYIDNFIGLIPRFIWEDKPDIGLDMNRIGHELGLVHRNDYATALGVTSVGVSYYEMGIIGVILLAAITSYLLIAIYRNLNENYWVGFLLSYMLTITLVRNGTFTDILPALIKSFIVFYLIALVLNKKITDEIKLGFKR